MITIREAWHFGRAQLSGLPSPNTSVRLLLEHVLQLNHASLVAHGDRPLSSGEEAAFRRLLERAREHEPIPYLTGKVEFYGLELHVNPVVLIPRPETELLVEVALAWARPRGTLSLVDVGTGSGCIAIALAVHLSQANIQAVDVSAAALAVARLNAMRHCPGRVRLVQGELLAAVTEPVDLIVANLPYVAADEWRVVDQSVSRYEPRLALDGGSDGLALIRPLLAAAPDRLRPGGMVLLEIGWQQGEAVSRLARKAFPAAEIVVRTDFADHDRLVIIRHGT
jgi:release factor glutamine methyltransferase